MTTFPTLCRAAAIAALSLSAPAALAAAPDALEPVEASPPATSLAAPIDYSLDTEMVVRNWVLCISQPLAEKLARAREGGRENARLAYVDLAGARSCGQFPELRVILRQRIYSSTADAGYDARVFGADVNLSGDWASVFVVSDVLSDEKVQ
jgi:hypothetical protein